MDKIRWIEYDGVKENDRRQAFACQRVLVQYDGKYASKMRAKPLGVIYSVVPYTNSKSFYRQSRQIE